MPIIYNITYFITVRERPAASVAPAPTYTPKTTTTPASSSAAPPLPALTPPPPTAAKSIPEPAKPSAAPPKVTSTPAPQKPSPSKPGVDVQTSAPIPLPSTLAELQKTLEVSAQIASKEYHHAIQVLGRYSEDVKYVVDRIIENPDNTVWATLKNKTSARDTAVESAERSAQEARATIGNLTASFSPIHHFLTILNRNYFQPNWKRTWVMWPKM